METHNPGVELGSMLTQSKHYRWRWSAVVVLLMIIIFCFLRMSERPRRVTRIEEASQPAELSLVLLDIYQPRSITGISVWFVGEIDGEGEFSIGDSTRVKVGGVVDRSVFIEWHDMRCDVRYVPITATSGSLEVRYRFHD